jgi:hypothetical protein
MIFDNSLLEYENLFGFLCKNCGMFNEPVADLPIVEYNKKVKERFLETIREKMRRKFNANKF